MKKDEELIKRAFQKVKTDILFLRQEIGTIKSLQEEIKSLKEFNIELRNEMINLCEILKELSKKVEETNIKLLKNKENEQKNQKDIDLPTTKQLPTNQHIIPTNQHIIKTYPTYNLSLKPLKPINISFSTGNQGVPTDRQTDRHTDRQTHQHIEKEQKTYIKSSLLTTKKNIHITEDYNKNQIENASELLNSLDSIKKEIRLKFKRLTDQEIIVFSTIYQLEEEKGHTDYKDIAEKLKLTESSIRDYVGRLIKKGIPVDKVKINNKNIHLSISKNLKKIATLSTILSLRDL